GQRLPVPRLLPRRGQTRQQLATLAVLNQWLEDHRLDVEDRLEGERVEILHGTIDRDRQDAVRVLLRAPRGSAADAAARGRGEECGAEDCDREPPASATGLSDSRHDCSPGSLKGTS